MSASFEASPSKHTDIQMPSISTTRLNRPKDVDYFIPDKRKTTWPSWQPRRGARQTKSKSSLELRIHKTVEDLVQDFG